MSDPTTPSVPDRRLLTVDGREALLEEVADGTADTARSVAEQALLLLSVLLDGVTAAPLGGDGVTAAQLPDGRWVAVDAGGLTAVGDTRSDAVALVIGTRVLLFAGATST